MYGGNFVTMLISISLMRHPENVAVCYGYLHSLEGKLEKRNKLYRQAKQTGSVDTYNRFLDLKHSIQRDMRKSYWQYINGLISPESVYNGCQQQKVLVLHWISKKDDTEISSLYTSDGLIIIR